MRDEVVCPEHGRQRIGLACAHIAHAIDSGKPVGFFWGDDTDNAGPDAWCTTCEAALLATPAGASTDEWFLACNFKILCAGCWDQAKQRLYNSPPT